MSDDSTPTTERTMSDQPITLGELIDLLAKRPAEDTLRFDFAYFAPSDLMSYRGYYDHLAIGYEERHDVKVGPFLNELRASVGKIYEGYNGGSFRMYRDTPMWVANYGESGSTAVVGVAGNSYGCTRIETAHCEDWDGGAERAMRVLFGGLGYGNV